MVHRPGKDRQGPAGAGGGGVMSCGDEWGRSSHTGTFNGASNSAACFESQLSPNEQVLVPCSSCTRAPPPWKVSEQGRLHARGTCGVLQHDASGRGIAGGTSSAGSLGNVNALARGAKTAVSSSRHANGNLEEAIVGGELHCRTKARQHGRIVVMQPSAAMKRQIISIIAPDGSSPSVGSISAGQG